jgi:small subunit ribosomal protein S3Ae
MTISDLVKSIISGDMSRMLSNVSKVIVPIKRVEIRKTEVLEMGSKASQDTSIIEAPAEEEKPEEAAAPAEAPKAEETEEIAPSEEEISEESEELSKESEGSDEK